MAKTETVGSAGRVLEVLDLLFQADFAHGMSPGDIAKDGRMSPSAVTRYVATLLDAGAVERIPETGRLRPSIRWAQHATSVVRSLDAATRRSQELIDRVTTTIR
jgi:DNA-binding IclR family transcriptional regulator